jgi:hypothetical protein
MFKLENVGEDEEEAVGIVLEAAFPWEGTDRDYKYEEVCL